MKTLLLMTALVVLTATSYAGNSGVVGTKEFKYTISGATLLTHCGTVRPTEGAVYLVIKLTAKNVSTKDHIIGGPSNGQFSVAHGDYHYDVDSGVGLSVGCLPNTYSGVLDVPPLISKAMLVVFTVPTEIAVGTWTVTMPTDETFDVTVNAILEHADDIVTASGVWPHAVSNTDLSKSTEEEVTVTAQNDAIAFHHVHPGIAMVIGSAEKFGLQHGLRGKLEEDYEAEFTSAYDALETQ
jgi:hypothetical protein